MKRGSIFYYSISAVVVLMIAAFVFFEGIVRGDMKGDAPSVTDRKAARYDPPSFYRGLYLSNDSACAPARFRGFLDSVENTSINAFVMDVQTSRYKERMVPDGHVASCLSRGIHPIARVVVFPGGLSRYPPAEKTVTAIIDIAERAARAGFKEIQFDYIRFSDENRHAARLRQVTVKERHAFIEKFLLQARARLSPHGVKIAADIFGRVPHNENDPIGQSMEVFDRHVDVICPMAYPSHYWTRKLRHDPYGTVLWTSSAAEKKTQRAEIVTWIQAFKMQHPPGMCFIKYIQHQIKAVHDANAKGFLLWNARQDYSHALKAVDGFYRSPGGMGKYAL